MQGTIGRHLPWILVGLLGAGALVVIATARGEPVGAIWIVVAAVCTYLIAYRDYARFIADRVMRLDPMRPTPAVRRNDGLDYVPTGRTVVIFRMKRQQYAWVTILPTLWLAACT